jgi:hypothetical protein
MDESPQTPDTNWLHHRRNLILDVLGFCSTGGTLTSIKDLTSGKQQPTLLLVVS